MEVCCPYFDPDFENLNERMYGPRISVDNESCDKCTVVKVDSLDKQGLLLEVLQVLTDMDLVISKSYISSDAGWFMDVFHVKDQLGNKVTDERVLSYIQQAMDGRRGLQKSGEVNCYENTVKTKPSSERTAIEMIGINRPGLFSEISAVLAEQRCNIVEAHAWSHNTCLACVAYVSDQSTSTCIDDPNRLATIEGHLSTVLQPSTIPDNDNKGVQTRFLGCNSSMSCTERRLHQLMLANRDFDGPSGHPSPSFSSMGMNGVNEEGRRMVVSIDRCSEKGYSIVDVQCMDRPKLMFDIVCTLTDMQYVIFHASITSHGPFACQEYYIRHRNGYMLNTANESQLVSKCLEAAIERRVCEGVRLELCAQNSVGLLPYVTRTLREYGLTVARADIATQGEKTKNVFYVQDISGNKVDMSILELMRRELEPLAFQVKNELLQPQRLNSMERESFSFGGLLREIVSQLYNST